MVKLVILMESGEVKQVLSEARSFVEVINLDGRTLGERMAAESRAMQATNTMHTIWKAEEE